MVIGGTKCPSITSKWTQSAPACSRAATSSPSRLKSAERSDGATSTLADGRDADRDRRVEIVVADDHMRRSVDAGAGGHLGCRRGGRSQRAHQLTQIGGGVGVGRQTAYQVGGFAKPNPDGHRAAVKDLLDRRPRL